MVSPDPTEYWYYNDWARAAVIGDTLYAISPNGVNAAPVENLALPTDVVFAP